MVRPVSCGRDIDGSLLQWIKTKKVTKCELCKYPFKLSKGIAFGFSEVLMVVYDPHMPSRVPHKLFVQRLLLQLRNNVLTYLRFLLVCFIWLGLVPFLARWIWRFYFRFGDWSAIPVPAEPTPAATPTTSNETQTEVPDGSTVFDEGFFGWLRGKDIWTSVLRDCFQGQIITICLVAVFVVVFLIREWVMQNAVQALDENAGGNQWEGAQQMMAALERAAQNAPPPPAPEPQNVQPVEQDEESDGGEDEEYPMWGREFAADERRREQERRLLEGNIFDPLPPQPRPEPPQDLIIPPPLRPAPVIDVRRNDDDDDDLDGDDFDGLWDILGMQGPIIGLLHNTVFSALMIALAVGLGVWLPFMFGKTALGALVFILSE